MSLEFNRRVAAFPLAAERWHMAAAPLIMADRQLSFGPQIIKGRTKRLNREVWRQGGTTTPLSDLFTAAAPPPRLRPSPEPNNLHVGVCIPVSSSTGFSSIPLIRRQNKNKNRPRSNLPGYPRRHAGFPGALEVPPIQKKMSRLTNAATITEGVKRG